MTRTLCNFGTRAGRDRKRFRLSERLRARDHRHCCAVQHGGLFQRQQQDCLGHGAGSGADLAGTPAHGLLHEHPAQCEPDYDRSGRPYVHRRRNRAEHLLLLLL